jgi:hypothetical protein
MKVGRFATQMKYSLLGTLVLVGLWPAHGLASDDQSRAGASHHEHGTDQRKPSSDLVRIVRESTEQFRDVAQAEAEGYGLLFGCVSGDEAGAMGMHFVNTSLIGDDVLDPRRPEIVIYEPTANGRLRLIGADFLVLADVWNAKHDAPPQLMGQAFHLFEAPNRFGLPDFYTLHVWAWKENPTGAFVNWHSKVSCDGFNGQTN